MMMCNYIIIVDSSDKSVYVHCICMYSSSWFSLNFWFQMLQINIDEMLAQLMIALNFCR